MRPVFVGMLAGGMYQGSSSIAFMDFRIYGMLVIDPETASSFLISNWLPNKSM